MNRQLLETLSTIYNQVRKIVRKPAQAAVDAATIFVPGAGVARAGYEALKKYRKTRMKPKIKMSSVLRGNLREGAMNADLYDTAKSAWNSVKAAGTKVWQGIKSRAKKPSFLSRPKRLLNIAAKKMQLGSTPAKVGLAAGSTAGMYYNSKKNQDMYESDREKGEERKSDEIEMTKKSFKKEHKKLFKVLKKCKHSDCKKELKKQKKEYKEEIKESFRSRSYIMNLLEASPKTIKQMAMDGYGRPMSGNLKSSINPSAKSAGVSFAKDAKKLRKPNVPGVPNAI